MTKLTEMIESGFSISGTLVGTRKLIYFHLDTIRPVISISNILTGMEVKLFGR